MTVKINKLFFIGAITVALLAMGMSGCGDDGDDSESARVMNYCPTRGACTGWSDAQINTGCFETEAECREELYWIRNPIPAPVVQNGDTIVYYIAGARTASRIDTLVYWGEKYPIVAIGAQSWNSRIWMAKNMNYAGPFTENIQPDTTRCVWDSRFFDACPRAYYPEPDAVCYDNDPWNCQKYGRLYNNSAALQVCPAGWRLPNGRDFESLVEALDNNSNNNITTMSTRARARGEWDLGLFIYLDNEQTNSSGFTALPSGIYNPMRHGDRQGFSQLRVEANWWLDRGEYYLASVIRLRSNELRINDVGDVLPASRMMEDYASVRCVKEQ